jgi:hypothetical protein
LECAGWGVTTLSLGNLCLLRRRGRNRRRREGWRRKGRTDGDEISLWNVSVARRVLLPTPTGSPSKKARAVLPFNWKQNGGRVKKQNGHERCSYSRMLYTELKEQGRAFCREHSAPRESRWVMRCSIGQNLVFRCTNKLGIPFL